MKRNLLVLCSLLVVATNAQDYFQQEVNYTMEVFLNDKNHEISAFQEIEYHNNSRTTLDTLYFHLWPNAYKHKETVLAQQILKSGQTNFLYAEEDDRGFIDQLDFKVNNKRVSWEYWNGNDDIAILILNEPLNAGGTIQISTPFHVKIPLGVYSRLGHMGESYQMTQWYPKPAVFDHEGWHPLNYLSQGEFYSEYGSYDVSITLPENYIVGATGDLQNATEIAWLDSLAVVGLQNFKPTVKSDTTKVGKATIKISRESDTSSEVNVDFPESSKHLKTIRYTQQNVHDFAWFADKRFNVLSGEVTLPNTDRKVKTWAMFTNRHADLWNDAIEYINDGLFYYSKWNGDYPYNQCTAVDGALTAGGGMEYPNVTVIGSVSSARSLETVIVHEVGHNWFFGILGSNERRYPWMDEGINSFNEFRYIKTKYPSKSMAPETVSNSIIGKLGSLEEYKHREENYLQYLLNAREGLDQACGLHSSDHTSTNYGLMVYTKTALAFEYLQAYLGADELDKAMHAYFQKWKYKHPQPADIKTTLEKATQKDLSWFFDDLINTNKKIDYKISKVHAHEGHTEIELKNKGGINGPVSVTAFKIDGTSSTHWAEGFKAITSLKLKGNYDSYIIDASHSIPEINRQNNFYNSESIFPKIEPLDIDLIWSLEEPSKTQVFLSPYVNFNFADKTILGISIHNKQILKSPFSYSITPAYSTGTKELVGKTKLRYSIFPFSKTIRAIQLYSNLERFHYDEINSYTKIGGELRIDFKKNPGSSAHSHQLTLRTNHIIKTDDTDYTISDISHLYIYKTTLKGSGLKTRLQLSDEFTKLTIENRSSLKTEKRGTYELRLFAGIFLKETTNTDFHFGLAQQTDYLYELGILDREGRDAVFSKQMSTSDGGFVIGEQYRASQYLLSANLQIPITKKIKGYCNIASLKSDGKTEHFLDTGLMLSIIPKRVEIFFPMKLTNAPESDKYLSNVRFKLNINIHDLVSDLRSQI
jgi:hypothetical protein